MTIRPITVQALEELANHDEQTRLWLSDGSFGEVSSFDEAVCQVFEIDIDRAIDRNEFSDALLGSFTHLRKLIHKAPRQLAPHELIGHPAMDEIRDAARQILAILKQEQSS